MAKTLPKNSQTNMSLLPEANPKNSNHRDNYKRGDWDMLFSFRQMPISDAYLEDLAVKLVEWSESDPEALTMGQFLAAYRISNIAWTEWRKRCSRLETAHKYALMCIGTRREVGGLKRKLDSSMVMRTMPQYSDDWKELNEWYARIRDEQTAHGNITVRMDAIPKLEEGKK